jgi:8-oxo-dGTP diphosphatase
MDDIHEMSAKLAAAFGTAGKRGKKLSLVKTRRRGTAIVKFEQGILLVSEDGVRFSLPGGAAEKDELWIQAAIRELREETGLCAYSAQYLFSHLGHIRKRGSTYSRNDHRVFLIEAEGVPTPCQEIKVIRFYQPGDTVKITNSTRHILERYRAMQS